MAAAAQAQAERLVLTSDNPRGERAADILAQMRAGLQPSTAVQQIEDRAAAIAAAVQQAAANDVVLVAGKGHETTQEVAGVFHPFSDVAQLQAALAARQAQEVQA
jgi:UDP-N-acetylmuramyl tripeptide synthase